MAVLPVVMAAAGAAALVAARRRRARRKGTRPIVFPDAAALAAETATSVRNAAKGAVIAAVREADDADETLVASAVGEAVNDALGAGADVAAVAIGAVEGALDVAHLVKGSTSQVAATAARAALDAATAHGEIAGARVFDLLRAHLGSRAG